MAYFNYVLSSHLKVPQKILDKGVNLEYKGDAITVATSPFEAEHVHFNYFNLSKSAIDNTSRIVVLESLPQEASSNNNGLLKFSGKGESQGYLYGGSPLFLKGQNIITFPYDISVANKRGFEVAVHGGINLVSLADSLWVPLVFGEESLPNATTITELVDYFNSTLAFSEKPNSKTFSINGDVSPATNWASTFGNLSSEPTSFQINVNFGETVKTVTLSNSFGSVDLPLLASTLTNLINISGVTVVVDGSFLKVVGNSDRLAGGITSITLQKTQDVSILDWLGWSKAGDTVGGEGTTCYDFRSIFEFVGNIDDTITLQATRLGVWQPGALIAIRDRVEDDPDVQVFFDGVGSFGLYPIGSSPTILKHARKPLSTWDVPLNYGGDFVARDGYFRNLYFDGSFNFTGTTLFEGIDATGLIDAQAGITSTTIDSSDATVGITGKRLAIDGDIIGTNLSIAGDAVFGVSDGDTFVVNSSATFANGILIPTGIQSSIGGVNFVGAGRIETLTVGDLAVDNLQSNTAILSLANLRVVGATTSPGYFNGGATLPSALGNVINYEGELKATRLFASNPSVVAGSAVQYNTTTKEFGPTTSDERLKTDIVDVHDDSLSVINALRPVRYSYKGQDEVLIGFIAQEVRKVVPEAVFGDESKEMLTVNFMNLLPHIVKAIQTLSNRVSELENNA